MPLEVLEADLARLVQSRGGSAASRCGDAQALRFDLIVKILQRDDPLRRSYLQKRWHALTPGRCDIERASYPTIAPCRR
jgi:hypothetical protein